MSKDSNLNSMSTGELEKIVHVGENLHIATSRASQAKRILETKRHKELVDIKKSQDGESDSNSDLTIFYSWQSDLPNNTNRGFIENALKKAVKSVSLDDSIDIVPRIDKDTAGVPGSPNIATIILEKIDKSFLIVSDVSIISKEGEKRPTPNPHVLYELGYAAKSIGVENTIMVQNTAYGGPEKLPFDLKMQRALTYSCLVNQKDKSVVKDELAKRLEAAIRLSLKKKSTVSTKKKVSIVGEFQEMLGVNPAPITFESKLSKIVDQTVESLNELSLYNYNTPFSIPEYEKRKKGVEKSMEDLVDIYFSLGKWLDDTYVDIVTQQLEKIVTTPDPDSSYNSVWVNLAYYPGLLLLYSLSLGAIFNKNIQVLRSILSIKIHNRMTNKDEPVWTKVCISNVFRRFKDIFNKEKRYFPISDDLFMLFVSNFADLSKYKYEDLFDTLEYLLTLLYATREIDNGTSQFWVPLGAFAYRTRRRKIWVEIMAEFELKGKKWIYCDIFDLDKLALGKLFKITNSFLDEKSAHYW